MTGRIVKGIAGFYYVACDEIIYECKARGVFRNKRVKPLVGDLVEIEVLSEEEKTGNIIRILPRESELIRPAVANVSQALVIFAVADPKPNLHLLDTFLVMMEQRKIKTIICFNKIDAASQEALAILRDIYEKTPYEVLFVSGKTGEGLDEIKKRLLGRISTVAGPSGAGKSTIINQLQTSVVMETGSISEKLGRGKHTTRHSELIEVSKDSYIMDTPGFTSLDVSEIEPQEIAEYFPEFAQHEPYCKFQGCAHRKEPQCGVKDAVEEGVVSAMRYDSYALMYDASKERKRY